MLVLCTFNGEWCLAVKTNIFRRRKGFLKIFKYFTCGHNQIPCSFPLAVTLYFSLSYLGSKCKWCSKNHAQVYSMRWSCNHNRNHLDNKLLPAVATPDMWSINPLSLIYDQLQTGSFWGPVRNCGPREADTMELTLGLTTASLSLFHLWVLVEISLLANEKTEHNHLGVPFSWL